MSCKYNRAKHGLFSRFANTTVQSTVYLDSISCNRNPIPESDSFHDLKVENFSFLPIIFENLWESKPFSKGFIVKDEYKKMGLSL